MRNGADGGRVVQAFGIVWGEELSGLGLELINVSSSHLQASSNLEYMPQHIRSSNTSRTAIILGQP